MSSFFNLVTNIIVKYLICCVLAGNKNSVRLSSLLMFCNWYWFFNPFCFKSQLLFSLHRHWLTCTYIMFAVPYFVYDIYAMFMCYWYKLQVKGHEEASAVPQHMSSALTSYLRREFLMVLHHVVMVTVCFPVSVVTVTRCSFCQFWDLSEAKEKVQHWIIHMQPATLRLFFFLSCPKSGYTESLPYSLFYLMWDKLKYFGLALTHYWKPGKSIWILCFKCMHIGHFVVNSLLSLTKSSIKYIMLSPVQTWYSPNGLQIKNSLFAS